ncbi:MAG TPA: hypothetical protein DIW23_09140 [Anaerolineae bacterium]|nr:hypothetical protein [Anaerolineae bacterium]
MEGINLKEKNSDYYNLQTELYRMYNRKRNIKLFLLFSFCCGVLSAIYGIYIELLILNVFIISLFITFIVFFIITLLSLIWVNINQSDYEEKMVKRGIGYLSKKRFSQKRIGIIGNRAEIGSNALSSRTILPISVIPLLITYFSGKVSFEAQLFIAIVIMFISFSFVLELDRANMDIIIRQICVSYVPPQGETQKKKITKKKK